MPDIKGIAGASTTSGLMNSQAANGSPKVVYLVFILSLCKEYFDASFHLDNEKLERVAITLVCLSTPTEMAVELTNQYQRDKKEFSVFQSCSMMIGKVRTYTAETLELEEKSFAGLL